MAETVNHPPHYNAVPGIECIDVVENFNFNVGNAIKYLWRAGHKGDKIEDLRKAAWYVNREIERLDKRCPRVTVGTIRPQNPAISLAEFLKDSHFDVDENAVKELAEFCAKPVDPQHEQEMQLLANFINSPEDHWSSCELCQWQREKMEEVELPQELVELSHPAFGTITASNVISLPVAQEPEEQIADIEIDKLDEPQSEPLSSKGLIINASQRLCAFCKNPKRVMSKSAWFKYKGKCGDCRGVDPALDGKPGPPAKKHPLCVECNFRAATRTSNQTCEQCYSGPPKINPGKKIKLSEEDSVKFVEQVLNSPGPSQELIDAANRHKSKFRPESPEAQTQTVLVGAGKKPKTENAGGKIWGAFCKQYDIQKAHQWIEADGICTTCHKITAQIEVQGAERGGCKVYRDESVKLP